MRVLTSPAKKISSRRLTVAAENIVAAQFALCGFDVLEQAGHAKFFYDLGVAKSGGMMKVKVHGSLDGFWDLVDLYLDKSPLQASATDYHRAIHHWLERHSASVVCCLVQFDSDNLGAMPRMYLASAAEIAHRLHESTDRLGDSALYEQYEVTYASGAHTIHTLPDRWRFCPGRITQLMDRENATLQPFKARFSNAETCAACAAQKPGACLDCLPMMN